MSNETRSSATIPPKRTLTSRTSISGAVAGCARVPGASMTAAADTSAEAGGHAHAAGEFSDPALHDASPRYPKATLAAAQRDFHIAHHVDQARPDVCLLYTSDAADERSSVDLG